MLKPWRDWGRHSISVIKGCIKFYCVNRVHEDRFKTMLEVLNWQVQKKQSSNAGPSRQYINIDALPMKPGYMCGQALKYSSDQVGVKLSTWYPIITLGSPGLMPTRDSELTMSVDRKLPGKKDSSLLCREGGWFQWLCQAPKAVCPTIMRDSWMSRMKFFPFQSIGRSSHSVHSWHGQMNITRRCICLPRAVVMQTPRGWDSIGTQRQPHGNLKAESKHHNKDQYMMCELVGDSTPNRKLTCTAPMAKFAYAWEGSYHWGIVVRPTEPLTVSLGINSGSRTTLCWSNVVRPTELGFILTVTVMSDVLEHTTSQEWQ